MNYFTYDAPFALEGGPSLPGITIAYHTYGRLNEDRSNVVWVCHALTANSDAGHWWPGVVGENGAVSPDDYFIVCANILGSCYGSTGPLSEDSRTAKPYFSHFPAVTIRDMVRAHILLRKHLGIGKIHLLMGGSMGGYQALEWAVMEKDVIQQLFLIATSPAESAWGIAVHTAQRLAIEADGSWRDERPDAGARGLKAARAIGILTYRNYGIMVRKQTDTDVEKLDGFKASSYIDYQGDKLVSRFNAYCYWLLTKAMDSHQLARGRGKTVEDVLKSIEQRTLLIGVTSDILCPMEEQRHMADHLPNVRLVEIDSVYGHDGFMVEGATIATHLREWLGRTYQESLP
ncbi:homoserine O-acetyltransferase family protein [Puia sp. P3]|uniref:homoserine O-acetyltransferase family protein n=1 Tax=Puia sp. P3 TaxID=3423952 RepID=UPI003D66D096